MPPPPGQPTGAAGLGAVDRPFSVGDAFSWGWEKFTQNWSAIVIATLIYVVALGLIEIIFAVILRGALLNSTPSITVDTTNNTVTTSSGAGWFAQLLFGALSIFVLLLVAAVVQSGIIHGALEIADGKRVEFIDFFKFEKIGAVIVGGLLVGIATGIGYLLCIIPGIIVAFLTPFYLFFILDKNQSPVDAIMSSVRIVSQNVGAMILLILAVYVAYFVGALVCLVGLIVTMPVALLAMTFGYRKLQNEPVAA
jgi:uncharacterized membrane protein